MLSSCPHIAFFKLAVWNNDQTWRMLGKCNQIYWVCPASPITSLNSGVWIIVPLGGWGAPKPQTVMRRNINIHIPKCVSMVYDDFFSYIQTADQRHLRFGVTCADCDFIYSRDLFWGLSDLYWDAFMRKWLFMPFQLLKTINHFINCITKRVMFSLLLIPPSSLSSLIAFASFTLQTKYLDL